MTAPYVIDSNIIIDGRNQSYPPDVFPRLWDQFETMVGRQEAVLPKEVLEELERGDDDCATWCKGLDGFVLNANEQVLEQVVRISTGYPDFVQGTSNFADPFVIAHAHVLGGTAVSNERRYNGTNPEFYKIPNICEDLGVPHLKFVEFMRAEGWTF